MKNSSKKPVSLRIGIDIGGTFTDFVYQHPATQIIKTYKVPSTPEAPARAVINGLNDILAGFPDHKITNLQIVHGSTVATNSLLERKGAKTAFITTHGFKDVLHIGRQNRTSLYDFTAPKHEPLIPRDLCFEIAGRISKDGNELIPLDTSGIRELIDILTKHDIQSVAVGFLFSFVDPAHEMRVAKMLRDSGFDVSVSSEIIPEYREYERFSTSLVNAYVSPIFRNYVNDLSSQLPPGSKLSIIQSNGGSITPQMASAQAVRCILSGPAGGIAGAIHHFDFTEHSENYIDPQLITFDMGGTSTDVSLIDRQPLTTKDWNISGLPIRVPMLDIQTIGAGGGSIAYIDEGGILRVGPESVGAFPGPACYGNAEIPTVTDANIVLGLLLPDKFLGGKFDLNPEMSHNSIEKLAKQLSMDKYQVADGIHKIVNAHMDKAIRVISIERGYDPKLFSIISFGGAGGLHSAELAQQLNIPWVIIPQMASTFSAYGMLSADITRDYSKTVMIRDLESSDNLENFFAELSNRAFADFKDEGLDKEQVTIIRSIDMRYQGQSYEIEVPFTGKFLSEFHIRHERLYGYKFDEKPVEIVNLRIKAIVISEKLSFSSSAKVISKAEPQEYHQVYMDGDFVEIPVFDGLQFEPGQNLAGPGIIYLPDTTVYIPPNNIAFIDSFNNILIEIPS